MRGGWWAAPHLVMGGEMWEAGGDQQEPQPVVRFTATDRLVARGLRLEYATIAWNVAEFFVTVGLGIAAGSLALVAFGLDSVIEVFASFVVVWHLRGEAAIRRHRTVRALRMVGTAFFALAALLTGAAAVVLVAGHEPRESPLGIAYLGLTVVVMLTLALAKGKTGRQLGSEPLTSEAAMTYLDAMLAAGVLVALVLNVVAGWWWADAAATVTVAGIAVREGVENHREADELGARRDAVAEPSSEG